MHVMVMAIAALVFGFSLLIHHCQAVQHAVGGTVGWTLTTLNYDQWSRQNTYKVGDTLLFNYNAGEHTVMEVNKADYDSCSTSTPLKTYTSGKDVVTLSREGNYWFICGIFGHCQAGMLFGITVTAAAASAPPPSSPPAPALPPPPTVSPPAPAIPISPTPTSPPTVSISPPSPLPPTSPAPTLPPYSPACEPSPPNQLLADFPTLNTPPPPVPAQAPSKSGSSANPAAEPRGNPCMLLLGTVALLFCILRRSF